MVRFLTVLVPSYQSLSYFVLKSDTLPWGKSIFCSQYFLVFTNCIGRHLAKPEFMIFDFHWATKMYISFAVMYPFVL